MHSEHLRNVRPDTVLLGWLIGTAVFSFAALALLALHLLPREGAGSTAWGLLVTAVGFFAGGWFAGWRAGAAPILHALAIGFVTVVWVVVSDVLDMGTANWSVGATSFAALLLVQVVAAAIGGRIGSREARRASAGAS